MTGNSEREPMKNEVIFSANSDNWVMKITEQGIKFNKDMYPESSPDDFAKAIIDILETALPIKFACPRKRTEEDRFYYQGKFFKTNEEFVSYVNIFPSKQANEDDFNRFFDTLKNDIWINLNERRMVITNGQLLPVIEEMFIFAIEKLFVK